MTADALGTPEAMASAAVVLTLFFRNILTWKLEGLKCPCEYLVKFKYFIAVLINTQEAQCVKLVKGAPGGRWWNYSPSTLSCSKVFATDLKIRHLWMKSMGAWSSNEL